MQPPADCDANEPNSLQMLYEPRCRTALSILYPVSPTPSINFQRTGSLPIICRPRAELMENTHDPKPPAFAALRPHRGGQTLCVTDPGLKTKRHTKKRGTVYNRSALYLHGAGAPAARPLIHERLARALIQRRMSPNTSERLTSFSISCRPSSYKPSITSRIPASQSFSYTKLTPLP